MVALAWTRVIKAVVAVIACDSQVVGEPAAASERKLRRQHVGSPSELAAVLLGGAVDELSKLGVHF